MDSLDILQLAAEWAEREAKDEAEAFESALRRLKIEQSDIISDIDEARIERCKNCEYSIVESYPEFGEYDMPYCTIHGYPCDMIKECKDNSKEG